MKYLLLIMMGFIPSSLFSQINVNIDFNQQGRAYSKFIFGKNSSLSHNSCKPLTTAEWTRIKDAGIKIFRENGGNNSTKYNWKKKLSSHPDWYNNVFPRDWDYVSQTFVDNFPEPDIQIMYGLQLIGKVAKTNAYNFSAWNYNQAQLWSGTTQNLAGGGQVNSAGGSDALVEGDTDLYLETWDADSTVGIFDHWFGTNGLGLDKSKFSYWCMDNEPGIWNITHDDIVGDEQTMEEYMQKYFEVAKKARAKYPEIKLAGPILANEWLWYSWHNKLISYQGQQYTAIEYFIKRVAEEQVKTGVRLLDVFTIHFYPSIKKVEDVVQSHRVLFDENYAYPGANGVHMVNGGWDTSINEEYIFKRARNWLDQYMGEDHGVELGMTEAGIAISDPDGTAVWYASMMGEFMKQDVSLFTPWHWSEPMWEVLHLFSNYSQPEYYDSSSSDEEMVSCYITVDKVNNLATCFIVNRDVNNVQSVNVNISGANVLSQSTEAFELANLSLNKTFYSKTNNALVNKSIIRDNNEIQVSLKPLSIVAINFEFATVTGINEKSFNPLKIYPNPVGEAPVVYVSVGGNPIERIEVYNIQGKKLIELKTGQFVLDSKGYLLNIDRLKAGMYFVNVKMNGISYTQKLVVNI